MLEDILNNNCKIKIGEKTYTIEFDHCAYAALEKQTGKSIYEYYDKFLALDNIMYAEVFEFLQAGLIKHHSLKEIETAKKFIQKNPSAWNGIKDYVRFSFLMPLLPPEYMRNVKKKVPAKKAKTVKN